MTDTVRIAKLEDGEYFFFKLFHYAHILNFNLFVKTKDNLYKYNMFSKPKKSNRNLNKIYKKVVSV